MKVKNVMRTRQLVSVRADDDLAVAGQMMLWAGVRHLPVLDEGRVVGVLTERDLLRSRAEGRVTGERTLVRHHMSAPVELVTPDDELAAACALMIARHIGCLPVVEPDSGELVGIVTTTDVVATQISAQMASVAKTGPRVELAMRSAPPTVFAFSPLLEAVGIMVDHDVRHVPVVDDQRRVVGIVSDRDVRTAIGDPLEALHQEFEELEGMQVATVMTTAVLTVPESAPLSEVARLFVHERVGAIPVVDAHHRLVGIVSYVDLIKAMLETAASDAESPATTPPLAAAPR